MPAGDTNGDVLAATGRYAAGLVADAAQHQDVAVWHLRAGRWHVHDLGDFGLTSPFSGLSATGVNRRGVVVVGVNISAVGAWVYTHGRIHRLKDFAGGRLAFVRAINNHGEMVGEALDAQGNDFGAIWWHWWSRPVKLRPVSGYDGSFAQGLNDRGDVVGGSFSNGPLHQLAVRWDPSGRVHRLRGLGGDAAAWSANVRLRTVGEATTAGDTKYAVVWGPHGHVRNLGLFAGDEFSRAMGVAPNGDVVGFAGTNPAPPAIPERQVIFWPGHGPLRSLLPLSRHWADGAYAHTLTSQGDVFGASAAAAGALPQPTEWTCALQQSFVPR
ncbi:MAG: hypothetical protein ACRDP1_00465 [Nocardioidaceae bacterium]